MAQTIRIDDPRYSTAHQAVLSHAMNGEAVAIEHYARMVPLADSVDEKIHLIDEAHGERVHHRMMCEAAKLMGIEVLSVDADPYWDQVKEAFRERSEAADLDSCYILQDVVLESFAVALYRALVQSSVDEVVAKRLRPILRQEEEHLADGIGRLEAMLEADESDAVARVEFANERVARVLAQWLSPKDCETICGVCGMQGGTCTKGNVETVIGLDMEKVQADFCAQYGSSLRNAGFSPNVVTRWLARLL